MLTDYMAIGSSEAWNHARLAAYLQNTGASPFTSGAEICHCETLTAESLGDEPYTTPVTDPAPWYDVDTPESGEFFGLMVLTVSGLEDNPRARNVTNAVGGGGVFGPVRALPRTITVTGLLIGSSCCGVDFGMNWLSEVLSGCTGDSCDGDCLSAFSCCPGEELTEEEFNDRHRRTFRRTALVSGPTVLDRQGTGSCARGSCGGGGDIIQVEFVLVAASPWAWSDPLPLLDVGMPIGGTGDCIDWCLVGSAGCASSDCSFAPCQADEDACADPRNPVPRPPAPTIPDASFCVPIAPERDCYELDLSDRPQWMTDVPTITVRAAGEELRNVRITMFEREDGTTQTCEEIADANRCNPLNDFFITYVPAGGAVTIDGQIGRATIECAGDCRTAATVFGDQDGGPVKVRELDCALYCFCIETDPLYPPSPDASVSLSISGRGA